MKFRVIGFNIALKNNSFLATKAIKSFVFDSYLFILSGKAGWLIVSTLDWDESLNS